MDNEFYLNCFQKFRKVAERVNSDLARDENLCRSIFHERVLFPSGVKSPDEAEARLRFDSKRFATPKAYANWLYTVFKNAILDHLRSESREEKFLKPMTDELLSSFADPDAPQPGEDRSVLEGRAQMVVLNFSREEKRLLTLRYLEGLTQEQVGRFFNVSTSTVNRWESAIKDKLASAISKEGEELEEKQQLELLGYILEKSIYKDVEK